MRTLMQGNVLELKKKIVPIEITIVACFIDDDFLIISFSYDRNDTVFALSASQPRIQHFLNIVPTGTIYSIQ